MGKQNTNMKIAWTGNTGGVVGFSVRGHHYTRSLAESVRNPRTEAQLEARAKFAFVSEAVSTMAPAYLDGYLHYNATLNQRANLTRQVYSQAVTGNRTDGYSLDYSKVKMSRGNLVNPYNVTAAATGGTVTVTWSDNSGVGNALATDKANILVYNASRKESVYKAAASARQAEEATAAYPTAWTGDTLYIYVWFSNGSAESESKALGALVG